MYYKCPYCDSRVPSKKKNCPNCGAASSWFEEVYENDDYKDKRNGRIIDIRYDYQNNQNSQSGYQLNQDKQFNRFVQEDNSIHQDTAGQRIGRVVIFIVSLLDWCIPDVAFFGIISIIVTCNIKSLNLKKGIGKAAYVLTMVELFMVLVVVIVGLVLSNML